MCGTIITFMMVLGGLYALIGGKLRLTRNLYLEGRRARIAGAMLIAPLPLSFCVGFTVVVLKELGAFDLSTANIISTIASIVLLIGGIVSPVLYARATKPNISKAEPTSQP